jgi:hypothetical protein
MSPKDRELASQLDARLCSFDQQKRSTPGIHDPTRREVFLEQLVESMMGLDGTGQGPAPTLQDFVRGCMIIRAPGVPGGFGNHRKYESLDADSPRGTGAVVESYVGWVNPPTTPRS